MNTYQNHAAMQDHIAQWQASSLSQTEYCKEHGIKQHIFSSYKKKFSLSEKPSSQRVPVQLLAEESGSANGMSVSVYSSTRRQTKPLDLKAEFFQLNSRAEIGLMPQVGSADLILVVQ